MIIKKYKNTPKIISDKSVIDHNQLANRDGYGCHTISAIRKLPEKLTSLKEKDIELENTIQNALNRISTTEINLEEITNQLNILPELQTSIGNIRIEEIGEGKFNFYNSQNNPIIIQSGYLPDNDSIILDNNELKINKIYTSEKFNGNGNINSPIDINIDNISIKFDNGNLKVDALMDDENNPLTANDIQNKFAEVDEKNEIQDHRLLTLEAITEGTGGYLTSNNFGKANPTQDELTNYAIQDIGNITTREEILDGTKVINLFDDHTWILDNIPDEDIFIWKNLGLINVISLATREEAGLVKGSHDDYKGDIDANGFISINKLTDKLSSIDNTIFTHAQSIQSNINTLNSIYENNKLKANDLLLDGSSLITALNDLSNTIQEIDDLLDTKLDINVEDNDGTTDISLSGNGLAIDFNIEETTENYTVGIVKDGLLFENGTKFIRPKINTSEDIAYLSDIIAYKSFIDIDLTLRENISNEVKLGLVPSQDFIVDWGDGVTEYYPDSVVEVNHNYETNDFKGRITFLKNFNGLNLEEEYSESAKCITFIKYDDNIEQLFNNAFDSTISLNNIDLPDSITNFSLNSFYNSGIKEIKIPTNITSLNACFQGCERLNKVELPEDLTSLDSTFNGCLKLSKINFPNSLINIGDNTFQNCPNLPEIITLPKNVSNIGAGNFNATNIRRLILNRVTPANIDLLQIGTNNNIVILVPYESLKLYKEHEDWQGFANKIYPHNGVYSEQIIIPVSAWNNGTTCTVEAIGATNEDRNIITTTIENNSHNVTCTNQGNMTLTFNAESTPLTETVVNVTYLLTNY